MAMLYVVMVLMITTFAKQFGLDLYRADLSKSWLVLVAVAGIAATLFFLWSLYLLIRFAIAFHITARNCDLRGIEIIVRLTPLELIARARITDPRIDHHQLRASAQTPDPILAARWTLIAQYFAGSYIWLNLFS